MTTSGPVVRPQLDLAFARRGDRTVLDRRLFRWPFVLTRTFALDAAPRHMLTAILQTSSGAVHGDDSLHQRIEVGRGAAAHVTTQGATSVHRADPEGMTKEMVTLRIAEGGILEYLPEPRILFPDAALDQCIAIECAVGGVALISDAFTIHDPAGCGRSFRRFSSTTLLNLGSNESVLKDRFDIDGVSMERTPRFQAFGSVVFATPGRADGLEALADTASASFAAIPGLYGAASLLPTRSTGAGALAEGVGVRLAGQDLRAVRAGLHAVWLETRRHLHGAAPSSRRNGA